MDSPSFAKFNTFDFKYRLSNRKVVELYNVFVLCFALLKYLRLLLFFLNSYKTASMVLLKRVSGDRVDKSSVKLAKHVFCM